MIEVEAVASARQEAAAGAVQDVERDWMDASWRKVGGEARRYAQTLVEFVTAPRAFVQAWREGREELMNPLGFLALSVLVLETVRSLGWWTLERAGSPFAAQFAGEKPFWAEIWGALGPALHFARSA